MVDSLTPAQRSQNMSRIRGKDTSPELTVRRLLHGLGYRYRVHRKDLPGTPDIAFSARRKAIMVHGCFWHRHPNCRFAYVPKSRTKFWAEKFARNQARDSAVQQALRERGWKVLVIWECELKEPEDLVFRLTSFLGPVVCTATLRKLA